MLNVLYILIDMQSNLSRHRNVAIFVGTHYIRRAWAVSENPARIARIVRVVNIAWSIIQVLALIAILIGGNLWIQDMQHQQQQMPYSSVSPQPTAINP